MMRKSLTWKLVLPVPVALIAMMLVLLVVLPRQVERDAQETAIENGKINADQLTFDVNREVGDQKMLFKYSGKISGDAITGKIVFGREKPLPHDWEATRVKE